MRVGEEFDDPGVEPEPADLVRQHDIGCFRQIEIERHPFQERLPVLKAVGGADGARDLDDATVVDRIDPSGPSPARQQTEHAGAAPEIDHDGARLDDLGDRPSERVDTVRVLEEVTVLVKLE